MKTLLLLATIVMLAGCATTPNALVETQIGDSRPPYFGHVQVFDSMNALDAHNLNYEEVAVLRIDSLSTNEEKIQETFIAKARELGADAIVLKERDRKILYSEGSQTESIIFRALAIDLIE